jgi:hypothetical protein
MVYVRLLTVKLVDRTSCAPVARWRGNGCPVTVCVVDARQNPGLRYGSYSRADEIRCNIRRNVF